MPFSYIPPLIDMPKFRKYAYLIEINAIANAAPFISALAVPKNQPRL